MQLGHGGSDVAAHRRGAIRCRFGPNPTAQKSPHLATANLYLLKKTTANPEAADEMHSEAAAATTTLRKRTKNEKESHKTEKNDSGICGEGKGPGHLFALLTVTAARESCW